MYDDLLAGGYGKFSGHTHPPGFDISPSTGDREFLTKIKQERSGIWGDAGYTVFGRIAAADPIIQAQIRRAKMARLYGGE